MINKTKDCRLLQVSGAEQKPKFHLRDSKWSF